MKLVTYVGSNGDSRLGALEGDTIIDLQTASNGKVPGEMIAFLAAGPAIHGPAREAVKSALATSGAACVPLSTVRLLPPVPKPGKMICIGRNYQEHIDEGGPGRESTGWPTLFARFPSSFCGPQDPIVKPRVSDQLDWEGELAVVIGRRGRHIPKEQAMDYVAGCTIFNDGSVRDYQRHTPQYTAGKNFDKTGPMGPYLALLDEGYDPQNLDFQTRVNGEVTQSSNTKMMIYDIRTLIAYISDVLTLEPGDVIATGTCAGVGTWFKPARYLKAGDRVRVEMGPLGVLENSVVDEI